MNCVCGEWVVEITWELDTFYSHDFMECLRLWTEANEWAVL